MIFHDLFFKLVTLILFSFSRSRRKIDSIELIEKSNKLIEVNVILSGLGWKELRSMSFMVGFMVSSRGSQSPFYIIDFYEGEVIRVFLAQ